MGQVTSVNQEEFEEKVLNSTKPVLVDFWAEWCSHVKPCFQYLMK